MIKKDKAKIQSMFNNIAKRYDLSNDVLSLGMHRIWQKRALKLMSKPINPDNSCLDLCTGTGALIPDLLQKYSNITAVDFSSEMLAVAKENYPKEEYPNLDLLMGDALDLKFSENSFDAITIAYGIRNFADLDKGLSEVYRVLKTSGELLIIEFGENKNFIDPIYRLYAKYILPVLGGLLTSKPEAYRYLSDSSAQFPSGDELKAVFEEQGFKLLQHQKYSLGIVNAYLLKKTP